MLTSKKPTYVTLPGGAGGGSKKLRVLPGVEVRFYSGASNEPGVDGEIGVCDEFMVEVQDLVSKKLAYELLITRKAMRFVYGAAMVLGLLALWGWLV